MKTISPELKADYANGSKTISRQWKATRTDGFVLAVTTCSRDLLIDDVVYKAAEGFVPKAIAQDASGAVANTEVEGASDTDSELEFEAGLWDGCVVEVFEVNYRALSHGRLHIGTTTMGDIKCSYSAFNAELRGMAQAMQVPVGRIVTANCPWVFGGPECKVDLGPITVTGGLTDVVDRKTFSDSSRTEPTDYFGGGVIEFTSGENAGFKMEVYSYDGEGNFVLHLPMPRNLAVGDEYSLVPGCRKRFSEDCVIKWNNGNNFGGFPYVAGPDSVLGLGGTEGTNL